MRSRLFLAPLAALLLTSCGGSGRYPSSSGGSPNMGGPTKDIRKAQIANEPSGNYFYGRRYFVPKTRFWGYLRKPKQNARNSKLVVMNENQLRTPDRLPEDGPAGQRYGFDHNYEYRIHGRYTGRTLYEPNSNQFLPEFQLTNYELVQRNPGWLFSPKDHYSPTSLTLRP